MGVAARCVALLAVPSRRLYRQAVAGCAVTATLLPIPDDPRFPALIESWPEFEAAVAAAFLTHPRSKWLREFESLLREFYPQSSSRDRSLTARHYAPFPLAAGHDVP